MKRGTTNSDAVRRVQNANPGVSLYDLYHTTIVTNQNVVWARTEV